MVTPTMKTEIPMCARCMPKKLRGCRLAVLRKDCPARVDWTRSTMLSRELKTIQLASSRLSATSGFHSPCRKGAAIPTSAAARKAQRRARASSPTLACFQRANGATPIRKAAGSISGTKTASK
jgi:hypothetical protein